MTAADRQAFLKRQREMCLDRKAPFFMPSDGYCPYCGKDVVKREIEDGNDGRALVTGCPYCCKSYCE
jgi:hypothetical protein